MQVPAIHKPELTLRHGRACSYVVASSPCDSGTIGKKNIFFFEMDKYINK